ncbi:flagellar basal body-associated FliL family protein [Spiribacter halobius]|nr:flagellar basal body-associated FliL family protein [Spiribacter halobius]UEX79791.1 flagellar basal body-associated FliL family protein [Spiribacter halobius]
MPNPSPRRQRGLSTLVLVILIAALLLAITGGTLATLYFAGLLGGGGEEAAEMADGEPEPEPPKPPIYLPVEPALITHFEDDGRSRYLQVGIQLMAREQPAIDVARQHLPKIRNDLLMLMSGQEADELQGPDGRQRLREAALAEVNEVLAEAGADERLEDLYFTEFVMQ